MSFFSASLAPMKRSIGCCTDLSAISGSGGFTKGLRDHQFSESGRFKRWTRGSGAPRFTHSSSRAISASGIFSLGGIW